VRFRTTGHAAHRSVSPCRLSDDVLMEAVPGLRRAVVSEYRRVVRPPWEIPTALVTNGALMVAAWFLLPPRAHAFLFSLNGPLAFPVILASWMLADTPATNVMGSSPALALSVLRDQAAYWRWLAARCIVIGSLIGVACAAGVMYATPGPAVLPAPTQGARVEGEHDAEPGGHRKNSDRQKGDKRAGPHDLAPRIVADADRPSMSPNPESAVVFTTRSD
jgi:hypothetical protein